MKPNIAPPLACLPIRFLIARFLMAVVLSTLFLTAPTAKAQVTGTDLTAMRALASLPNSAQTSLTSTPNCTLGYVPSGTVPDQLVSTDANGNQVVSPDATFVEP